MMNQVAVTAVFFRKPSVVVKGSVKTHMYQMGLWVLNKYWRKTDNEEKKAKGSGATTLSKANGALQTEGSYSI